MTAVRGVGAVSASALLAAFPELGFLSKNQAAALAGLALTAVIRTTSTP